MDKYNTTAVIHEKDPKPPWHLKSTVQGKYKSPYTFSAFLTWQQLQHHQTRYILVHCLARALSTTLVLIASQLFLKGHRYLARKRQKLEDPSSQSRPQPRSDPQPIGQSFSFSDRWLFAVEVWEYKILSTACILGRLLYLQILLIWGRRYNRAAGSNVTSLLRYWGADRHACNGRSWSWLFCLQGIKRIHGRFNSTFTAGVPLPGHCSDEQCKAFGVLLGFAWTEGLFILGFYNRIMSDQ